MRSTKRSLEWLAPAWLALAAAGCSGGGSDGTPSSSVTVLSSTCPGGVGGLPSTICKLLEVETKGNPPMQVELRITEPGAPYSGTVLLTSGSSGNEFFADIGGGTELIADLTALGFRCVDRRWPDGWITSSFQLKPQSARLAALVDWIRQHVHQGGLFMAVGNSGGAGEIAYTLSTWNGEQSFDRVVMAGGPPFTRIDYLCRPAPPEWSAQCPGFLPPLACGLPSCTAGQVNILCNYLPTSLTESELHADSILHPGADTDYGALQVDFILGSDDCSDWIPQAVLFHSAVTSATTLQVIPNTPHTISSTPQGRDAIVQALLGFAPLTAPVGQVAVSLSLLEDGELRQTLEATRAVDR
jgi:hypothetical protein